jgi:uncharacterized membrane protein
MFGKKTKTKSAFRADVSKSRLEFLFDGVFAIAMTILVLELKLPEIEDRSSANELKTALLHHWRTFFSYILSFVILSAFWFGHNQIYAKLRRVSVPALFIHIWLLATAAFIPFCAHLYGRYPGNPVATAVYFGAVIAYLLGMSALVIVAARQKLFDPDVPAADIKRLVRGFLFGVGIMTVWYVFAFVLRVID